MNETFSFTILTCVDASLTRVIICTEKHVCMAVRTLVWRFSRSGKQCRLEIVPVLGFDRVIPGLGIIRHITSIEFGIAERVKFLILRVSRYIYVHRTYHCNLLFVFIFISLV